MHLTRKQDEKGIGNKEIESDLMQMLLKSCSKAAIDQVEGIGKEKLV